MVAFTKARAAAGEDAGLSRLPDDAAQVPPFGLLLRHPVSGQERFVPLGYSRRVLLLGPLALAGRGDWALALVCVVLPVLGQNLLAPTANRLHLKRLIRAGFRAVSTEPGRISLAEWRLGMQIPRYTGRRAA